MTNDDAKPETASFRVEPESVGMRFDRFLAQNLPEFSRVQLRRLINAASATVDGKRQKAAMRLHEGQAVFVEFPELQPINHHVPEDIPLHVIFEDEHLIAIDKPPRMVVHPSKGHWSGTLVAALSFHFQSLSSIGGASRPGIVHRLDRDTSGVILVAKHDQAHLKLAQQFENRTVQKEYLAICKGTIDRDRDTIEQPIGTHPYHREKMAIRARHGTSRQAKTFYEVTERLDGFTLFRVFPKTGRTHQIRIHLTHIGCPIVCDPLYAGHKTLYYRDLGGDSSDESIVLNRLALHAKRIEFEHPISGKRMECEADLPSDLENAIGVLRRIRKR